MKAVRKDPITGLLTYLSALAQSSLEGTPFSSGQITTEVGNITIDTCLPRDTNIWETGIERPDIEGKWVIVEQYPDEEAAQQGHEKWTKLMTKLPNYPLRDIDQWGFKAD